VEEYSYMDNENYALSLQPTIVDLINENTIFEVGQCSGTYNGKCFLDWKKGPDGKYLLTQIFSSLRQNSVIAILQ
jgi:hypothetical protein